MNRLCMLCLFLLWKFCDDTMGLFYQNNLARFWMTFGNVLAIAWSKGWAVVNTRSTKRYAGLDAALTTFVWFSGCFQRNTYKNGIVATNRYSLDAYKKHYRFLMMLRFYLTWLVFSWSVYSREKLPAKSINSSMAHFASQSNQIWPELLDKSRRQFCNKLFFWSRICGVRSLIVLTWLHSLITLIAIRYSSLNAIYRSEERSRYLNLRYRWFKAMFARRHEKHMQILWPASMKQVRGIVHPSWWWWFSFWLQSLGFSHGAVVKGQKRWKKSNRSKR